MTIEAWKVAVSELRQIIGAGHSSTEQKLLAASILMDFLLIQNDVVSGPIQ